MKLRLGFQLALAAGLFAQAQLASAETVLFPDNFDSIATTTLNAPPSGWQTPYGTVDSINAVNVYGIHCAGNSAGCVDLDGSTSVTGFFTTAGTVNLAAGQKYSLTFDYSGNQRGGSTLTDNLAFGVFNKGVNLPVAGDSFGFIDNIAWDQDFSTYTLLFTAARDGAAYLFFSNFGSGANDNIGTILDNVKLSAVPIPAAGWLLISGLIGLVGVARSRVSGEDVRSGGSLAAA